MSTGFNPRGTLLPGSFVRFPFLGGGTTINGVGEIEFEFTAPDDAALFLLLTE